MTEPGANFMFDDAKSNLGIAVVQLHALNPTRENRFLPIIRGRFGTVFGAIRIGEFTSMQPTNIAHGVTTDIIVEMVVENVVLLEILYEIMPIDPANPFDQPRLNIKEVFINMTVQSDRGLIAKAFSNHVERLYKEHQKRVKVARDRLFADTF